MPKEKGSKKRVWLIMMILSLLFTILTVLQITDGDTILEHALTIFTSSSLEVESLDEAARGFLNMAMVKPLWEEIWIGILGIFCALGLRKKIKYAWTLGILWGAMMLTNGLVQGGYELFILNWTTPCVQTYIFLVLGVVTLVSLIVARREFLSSDKQAL